MNNPNNLLKYKFHIYVSFSDLFPEEETPDVNEILSHYSRESIISIALAINNYHQDCDFENCKNFFSHSNQKQYNEIMCRYNQYRKHSLCPNASYRYASFVTGLELLRHMFSLPLKNTDDYRSEDFEYKIFRAILIINQNTICHYKPIDGINKYQLMYLNNLCYVDIGKDLNTLAIQQFVYSYNLFKFLSTHDDKTKALLASFEHYYEVTWKNYILTLMSVYSLSLKHNGRLSKNLDIDDENQINPSVLEKLTIPINAYFKYASDNKDDRSGNSDYRYFRDAPLLFDGSFYILYSSPMLLGKLYNSLFFNLQIINKFTKPQKLRINNIAQLFQVDFMQNYFLVRIMRKIILKKQHILCEKTMENYYVKHDNELGAPDLIIQSSKYIILFECKDIRLNAWVKEQKDYSLIIEDWERKILGSQASDHKGIGQLTGHLKNIRENKFPWAKVSPGKRVYPVLFISDPSIIQEGLYGIINEKYNESIRNKNVRNISANRQLIVMSPITLIKYESKFRKKGLVYYFEKYYSYLKDTNEYELSFEHFMGWKSYKITDRIIDILHEIKS